MIKYNNFNKINEDVKPSINYIDSFKIDINNDEYNNIINNIKYEIFLNNSRINIENVDNNKYNLWMFIDDIEVINWIKIIINNFDNKIIS